MKYNNPLQRVLTRFKSDNTEHEHIDIQKFKEVTSHSTTPSTPSLSQSQHHDPTTHKPSDSILYNVRLRTSLSQDQVTALWTQIHNIIHQDAPEEWPHVYAIEDGMPRGWVASSLGSMGLELPAKGHDDIAMRVRRECEGVVEISRAVYV